MASPQDLEAYLTDLRARQQKSWPAGTPREVGYLLGEIPLTEYLRRRAAETPDKTAYVYYGREITFAEVDRVSDRVASFLIARGVCPGDRVGVMLSNCPQFVFVFYGILKAATVHVPINPMFREAELAYELEDSGAKAVFALDILRAQVEAVGSRCGVHTVVTTALSEYLPERPTLPLPKGLDAEPEATSWRSVLESELVTVWPEQDLDALAALNYTGGTTGMPKGCEHTQRNMLYTAATVQLTRLHGDGEHIVLDFLPQFWIAGENSSLIQPVYSGSCCVLLNRWDPLAVLEAVQRYRVTATGGTVDNYLELLEHPPFADYDLSSVTLPSAMSFVTKLSPEIRERWREAVGPHSVLQESAYGMTETHTMDTFIRGLQTDDLDLKARPVFCGLPAPGTELKVASFDDGSLLPLGSEGEICVRSPSLLRGYWNAPEATAAALGDGWFRTGDSGVIDEFGFLHYLGRRKEMLKVNGMSVFPSELEVLLNHNPAVAAVAVVGVPDSRRGERPLAFVQLTADAAGVTEDEVRDWCRANMAPYKVPLVRFVDEMPLTATGKIRKNVLAEQLRPAAK